MSAVLTSPPHPLGRPIVDAAFLANPYPTYQALREAGPIHWSEEFFGGAWLLTRHADVEGVLRDPRFAAQRTGGWVNQAAAERGALAGFQQLFARALLFLDAPDHGRLRALLQPAFRPEALARLRPQIARIADELIDGLDHADEFDFIARLARPLPVRVISAILGIEGADRAEVMAWSDDLAAFIGAPEPSQEQARRAQASLLAMTRYFQAQLAAKRAAPGDDLLSELLKARERGEIRDDAELLAQCAMLLFAGHETTRNLLGNGLFALLSHPEQWAGLRQDPAGVPGAVRELLRYDSPVQYTGRRVTTDLMLHGQRLRRGDLVLALIGSANRDPARHALAEALDITRADPGALSFGSGVHVCLGAALTRLEAEVVLGRLLVRWPDLQLASTQPQWCANPAYRGLAALPLRRA
ncbi:biofilm PGA synthesis protein PgaC [Limnohabitans sp. MMS-10A-160]|jgi:cytochrome P450|uniref:cytochrome P450 n=1 Tax=unclassified Limnohabitans TaxID=2626134 RepID=UPI000D37717B|nr:MULTISPECIES: cytochrome P450 [unclassified Limnohabitans]PUE14592.1 biofilm PGA synthesis protein PgaC [Limnohabitans sp. MMS-10A-192]PUE24195.1 biofilm PGA synthesis protein PgaC [Limnohabitans sp. MMS-10A-160]